MTTDRVNIEMKNPRASELTSLSGKIALARLFLTIEALFPVILMGCAPLLLFATVSLLGVWTPATALIQWIALIAAVIATGLLAWWFGRSVVLPNRYDALRRLERDGNVLHEALQALEDTPIQDNDNVNPLWQAHLETMRGLARRAKLNRPASRSETTDPFGLRYPILGLFAVALVTAGNQSVSRLVAGFSPADFRKAGPQLADVWIEPPAYTQKAPIYLLRAGKTLEGLQEQRDIIEGSVIKIQTESRRASLRYRSQTTTLNAKHPDADNPKRREIIVTESGILTLRDRGRKTDWPIGVLDDRPPSVIFSEDPSVTDDGALSLRFVIDDDFGIADATLEIHLDPDQDRALDAPAFDETSLAETRTIKLDGVFGRRGERTVDIDLQSDRWAGLQVIGKIKVADAALQTAETEEVIFQLPERRFFNPLAQAVIEQRRTLATAPSQWRRAEWALSGLTLAPERFFENSKDYLLLRTAMWRVSNRGDENQAETVNDLWPLALQLEDEALTLARRQLEAAEEALKQALENGASDEELERLTENLRAAMQNYLEQLAQSGQQLSEGGPPPDQTLDQADLDQLLDSIRDLAKSGAQDAARQALQELQNILNNLQLSSRGQQGQSGQGQSGQGQPGQGQSGQGQSGQGGEGQGGTTGQAGDLIGRQRDLANRSFQRGQQGPSNSGAPGSAFANEQEEIAEDLRDLLEEAARAPGGENGLSGNGDAAKALREALEDMEQAEQALESDNFRTAGTAMEQAISKLREGAEAFAQAEAQRRAQGNGEGNGEGNEKGNGQGRGPGRDPLGRPIGQGFGDGVEVPGISDEERARRILEELRRRLSDGDRSEEELDYLERLLERF